MLPYKKVMLEDGSETTVYFIDELVEDGVLITEETIDNNGVFEFKLKINVCYVTDDNATKYFVYDGDLLSPMQVHRIVSDILQFYVKSSSLGEFISIIDEFSVGSMSSSYQSSEDRKIEIYDWVNEVFEAFRSTQY
jgi:hypothetical protein